MVQAVRRTIDYSNFLGFVGRRPARRQLAERCPKVSCDKQMFTELVLMQEKEVIEIELYIRCKRKNHAWLSWQRWRAHMLQ